MINTERTGRDETACNALDEPIDDDTTPTLVFSLTRMQ